MCFATFSMMKTEEHGGPLSKIYIVNLSIFEFPASSNFKFLPRVEHLYAFQSIIQEQKLCARVPRTIP